MKEEAFTAIFSLFLCAKFIVAADENPAFPSVTLLDAEVITYIDPKLPPVIEVYFWDTKKHWVLSWVHFDSDGDWALDEILFFGAKSAKSSGTKKENTRRGQAEGGGDYFFSAYAVRNIDHVYPQDTLYRALEADKKFRLDLSGSLRLLKPPSPGWDGNRALRRSTGYEKMIEKLRSMKLGSPPKISNIHNGNE